MILTKSSYMYVLECSDNTLYTGYTTDLKKRLLAHNSKKGAKYTKARVPVSLKYYEKFSTKSEAMKRECEFKKQTRLQKKIFILENLTAKKKEKISVINKSIKEK